ncbi:hypothetical protein DY926_07545 [Komagataeibacter melaceti]|uniref:Uncharacterized protein n=1 Tax=Komagataeibacter melaceti TaxID=2766577 RepID=A0A371Z106_9PROT|nr:hypothetical protein DY926_07545 [Komagataeibacter melaceti]
MARTGPSRANSAFNDDFIEIHSFQNGLCDRFQIGEPNLIGCCAVDVGPGQLHESLGPINTDFSHDHQNDTGSLNNQGCDRITALVIVHFERQVFDCPP